MIANIGRLYRIGFFVGGAVVLLFSGAGCSGESDTPGNPYMVKAEKEVRAEHYGKAVALYREALRLNPENRAAYLRMAMLYEDHLQDWVSAWFYYKRYIEMEEGQEQKGNVRLAERSIERLREKMRENLLHRNPSGAGKNSGNAKRGKESQKDGQKETVKKSNRVFEQLKEENNYLRGRLKQLSHRVRELQNRAGEGEEVQKEKGSEVQLRNSAGGKEQQNGVRTNSGKPEESQERQVYVVKKGDNLSRLSEKFYGTEKYWRVIQRRNQEKLQDSADLVPGVRLMIPKKPEKHLVR